MHEWGRTSTMEIGWTCLQLSIQMFAEINIQKTNILKIENLGKEIEELVQIKSSKNTELVEAENLYKKTLKRLIAIETMRLQRI